MSGFEFYGANTFASCQYHADEFFAVLDDTNDTYPLLARAREAFEALYDDVFSYSLGETTALKKEVTHLVQVLELDLKAPVGKYSIFGLIARELDAVFSESDANKTDIKFRWG